MKTGQVSILKKHNLSSMQVFLLVFAIAFFLLAQYGFSFWCIILTLIAPRVNEILSITSSHLSINFGKAKAAKIMKSDKSPKQKEEEIQKLMNDAFKMGWQAAGGRIFNSLSDVKIIKDKEGTITKFKYNEN